MSRETEIRCNLLRSGAFYARLRARQDQPPHLICNSRDELKMSFSGVFYPVAEDADGNPVAINWLSDEIQPSLVIDGEERPLGVFMPATPTISEDGVTESIRVEAYDRCWRVRDTNSEQLLYWPAGTLYLDAIEQLLSAAGIEVIFATPSAAVLSEDREDWEIGASYLTVANQLLGEINYKPVWFDAQGVAILEPVSIPDAGNIQHLLDNTDPETMLLPGSSRETDIYSAPNVWVCVCANPDKSGPMSATAENDNPQSPLSIARRGRRICRRVQVDNISSQDALQAYADRLRDESMWSGETIQVSTALTPGHGVADVVGLKLRYPKVDPLTGERVEPEQEEMLTAVCIETAWDMELKTGGKMTHRLERLVYNLE